MLLQRNFILPRYSLKANLLALLLLPLGLAAQQRNFVSFSGGYSLPVGKFASENFNDPKAGIAGEGFFGQLSFEHKFADWIGVRTSASLNVNNTDAQPLIDQYTSQYGALLPNPETYAWQDDVDKWLFGALLIGPSGHIGLGSVELEGHVQGGVVLAESPAATVIGTSSASGPTLEGRVEKASAITYGFGAGASARFRLTDRLRIQITADAIGANVEVDLPTFVTVGNFPTLDLTETRDRFVSVVNVGAGLVFGF